MLRRNGIGEREKTFLNICLVTCRDKDIPKRLLLKVLKVLVVFCLLFKE